MKNRCALVAPKNSFYQCQAAEEASTTR